MRIIAPSSAASAGSIGYTRLQVLSLVKKNALVFSGESRPCADLGGYRSYIAPGKPGLS